ncbi:MAG: hypothetical protein U5O16_06640 [Rhodococcus sp. (in: high G+C Gram-positive bacteria)]|uniref:hypothetical protein n=1 Tax=Rhodococcus sp. TaxID=1831 RepID=UPI002ADA41DD|nr:hypothetical protein [Rhodococcus sp. (in: high G+C Gram-positive bacteria)]
MHGLAGTGIASAATVGALLRRTLPHPLYQVRAIFGPDAHGGRAFWAKAVVGAQVTAS